MKILAIESSCDETAAAVVENGVKILSQVVASSQEIHQKTGGVIPEVAAREQVKCIIPVIEEALQLYSSNEVRSFQTSSFRLRSNSKKIDAIAVTVGPGLIGSLLVGVETAKTLAYVWNKPIIPINHLVAHLYANWLNVSSVSLRGASETSDVAISTKNKKFATLPLVARKDMKEKPQFPAVCLVVSGGHTELVLMEDHGKLKYLGGTRDDAAGECFDKSARLLGLTPYNGGPAIAEAAERYQNVILGRSETTTPESDSGPIKISEDFQGKQARMTNIYTLKLPRPMMNDDNLEFSFSGLKTAVLREVEKLKTSQLFDSPHIEALAFELQEAITDVLVAKTIMAIETYQPKSFLLAGGVAANQKIREKLKLKIENFPSEIKLLVPPIKLCTDNAAYIASCAFFNYHPVPWQKITADPGLTIT